jgi:ribosomal protein L37AE/L43A
VKRKKPWRRLDGREHNCLYHLTRHEHESVETHGERFHDEWWECTECGAKFTAAELEKYGDQTNAPSGA